MLWTSSCPSSSQPLYFTMNYLKQVFTSIYFIIIAYGLRLFVITIRIENVNHSSTINTHMCIQVAIKPDHNLSIPPFSNSSVYLSYTFIRLLVARFLSRHISALLHRPLATVVVDLCSLITSMGLQISLTKSWIRLDLEWDSKEYDDNISTIQEETVIQTKLKESVFPKIDTLLSPNMSTVNQVYWLYTFQVLRSLRHIYLHMWISIYWKSLVKSMKVSIFLFDSFFFWTPWSDRLTSLQGKPDPGYGGYVFLFPKNTQLHDSKNVVISMLQNYFIINNYF